MEKRLDRFESAFKALFPSGDVDELVNTLIQGQSHQASQSSESRLAGDQSGTIHGPFDPADEHMDSLDDVGPESTGLPI